MVPEQENLQDGPRVSPALLSNVLRGQRNQAMDLAAYWEGAYAQAQDVHQHEIQALTRRLAELELELEQRDAASESPTSDESGRDPATWPS